MASMWPFGGNSLCFLFVMLVASLLKCIFLFYFVGYLIVFCIVCFIENEMFQSQTLWERDTAYKRFGYWMDGYFQFKRHLQFLLHFFLVISLVWIFNSLYALENNKQIEIRYTRCYFGEKTDFGLCRTLFYTRFMLDLFWENQKMYKGVIFREYHFCHTFLL